MKWLKDLKLENSRQRKAVSWRRHYNVVRPHAWLGDEPPAPEIFVPAFTAWPASLCRRALPATPAQPTLN